MRKDHNRQTKPSLYDRFLQVSIDTRLSIIFGFGLTVLISAFWSYGKHFGYIVAREVGNEGDWGTFGDFIGGTTNPILSFLALVGILWTISQTQRQTKTDNLFKIIELIHTQATKLMEVKTIVRRGELGHFMEEQISVADLGYRFHYNQSYDEDWNAILIRVHSQLTNLTHLLIQMRVYLIKLEQQSKDKSMSEFFKVHYFNIVNLLHQTKQGMPVVVHEFFSERSLSYLSKEATELIEKQRT